MRVVWRGVMLVALALALLGGSEAAAWAQALATTGVHDTVYRADGTPAGGSVVVSWNAFTTANGIAVQAGSASVTIGTGGTLDVSLAPNAGATPMGSYYTAVYGDAVVVVERNNHGAAVIAYLEMNARDVKLWRDARGEVGWLTTAGSKPGAVALLGGEVGSGGQRLMSRRLLAECRTFVSGAAGRTGAVAGSYDDLVMSMAMAMAVRELCPKG